MRKRLQVRVCGAHRSCLMLALLSAQVSGHVMPTLPSPQEMSPGGGFWTMNLALGGSGYEDSFRCLQAPGIMPSLWPLITSFPILLFLHCHLLYISKPVFVLFW